MTIFLKKKCELGNPCLVKITNVSGTKRNVVKLVARLNYLTKSILALDLM